MLKRAQYDIVISILFFPIVGFPHCHNETPFAAFTNYMNVLADFIMRVKEEFPTQVDNEELNSLLLTIRNQGAEIEALNKELSSMRKSIEQYNIEHRNREEAAETPAEAPAEPAPAPKKRGRAAAPKAAKAAKAEGEAPKKTAKKAAKK